MQLSVDNRKIELDDKILIVLRCRMLSDIEVAIQMLEFVRLVDVVVMLEHRECEALAESARAYVEKELVGSFYFFDVGCLVHIIAVIVDDCLEVHHAVRYAFRVFADVAR